MNAPQEVILITGSSGLIGRPAVRRFAESELYKLVGLNRTSPTVQQPLMASIPCDLGSDASVRAALAEVRGRYGERLAAVIHLAAYYDFSGAPSPLYDEINVKGTERLLRGLRDFHVEQFILASTMLVCAPCEPGERIDEDWPLAPKWIYPKSKFAAEKLVLAERGTAPTVLLRISGVYDEYCHAPLLAHQMRRIYERWLLSSVFPGDSTHGQAYMHVDDLVECLFRLVQRRAQLPPELALVIGEPETFCYDELQYKLGRLIHDEIWDTREIPKALAKTGDWLDEVIPLGEEPFIKPWMIDLADDHYALNIDRARSLLDWQPGHALLTELPKMVAMLKADPMAWYGANKLNVPAWLQETQGYYDRRKSTQNKQSPSEHPADLA